MQGLGTALRSISRGKSPSQDRDRSGLCVGRRFLPQARGLRMKEARGIYRVRRIGGLGSDARVTDTTTVMDVPESIYRARGYQPDFDKLPWQDEYDAKKSSEKL